MIGSWTNNTSLGTGMPLENAASASYNNYIYFIGGDNTQAPSTAVRYASVGNDGTLGTWNTTTSLPVQLSTPSAIAVQGNTSGYIYVLGGATVTANVYSKVFYYAAINSNGTIGAWQTQNTKFTNGIVGATLNIYNGSYMLVAGGYSSSQSFSSVSVFRINLTNGTFFTNSSGFPSDILPPIPIPLFTTNFLLDPLSGYASGSTVIIGSYIYTLGGYTVKIVNNKVNLTATSRICYAEISTSGGISIQPFKNMPSNNLPQGIARFAGFTTGNTIYVAGGDTGTTTTDLVYYSNVNVNGTTGKWIQSTSLPQKIQGMGVTQSGNYIYLVSGINNVGIFPNVYSANTRLPNVLTLSATAVDDEVRFANGIVTFTYEDGGYPVTNFTATSNPGGITASNTTGSPIIVPGLLFGIGYTFKVTLTNSAGTSTSDITSNNVNAVPNFEGEASPYVFVPSKVAGKPLNVTATPINTTTAIVNFTPSGYTGIKYDYSGDPNLPPTFDSFYNILYYTASCLPGNVSVNGPNPSIVITGLTPGGKYKFGARTTNDSLYKNTLQNGNSQWSDLSEEITLVVTSQPNPPTAVTAVMLGSGFARVSFTPPVNTGNATIKKYVVYSSDGTITADGTSSPIIVSGLTNNAAVTFTVTASNGAYTSVESSASNSVTPYVWVGKSLSQPLSCVSVNGSYALVGGNTNLFIGKYANSLWEFSNANVLSQNWTCVSINSIYALAGSTTNTYGGFFNGTTWVWTLLNSGPCSACSIYTGYGLFSANNNLYTASCSSLGVWTSAFAGFQNSIIPCISIDGTLGQLILGQSLVSIKYNNGWNFDGNNITGIPSGVTTVSVSGNKAFAVSGTSIYYGVYSNSVNIWQFQATNTNITSGLYQSSSINANTLLLGTTGGGDAYYGAFEDPIWSLSDLTTDVQQGIGASGGRYSVSTDGTTNFIVTSNGVAYYKNIGNLPGIVTNVSAIATDTGTYVYFTPNSNDTNILSYYAISSSGNKTGCRHDSPVFVRNLTPGSSYTFTVVAVNSVGDGTSSAVSNQVTMPFTKPDPPSGIIATALSGAAQVSFYPPTNNGGSPIIDYTVTSSPGGFTTTASSSPITVTGLTNGTPYTFRVTARNVVGSSDPSAASNSTTPSVAPGPPTNVVAVPLNRSVNLSFSPPSNTGGSVIGYYTITYGTNTLTISGTSTTIFGLNNGQSYIFGVSARNAYTSSTVAYSNSVIPANTVPTVPTNVSAAPIEGGAYVSFNYPVSNGGSTILDFTVTSVPGGITATRKYSPITITGLNPSQTYSFNIVARNAIGNSLATTSVNSITVPPGIFLPTNIVLSPLNSSININFNGSGTGASNYYVTSSPGNINVNAPGTASSILVPGLVNGTSYTFTFTSSNNVGSVSTTIGPVTPCTVASAPLNVVAVAGNTTAVVSFSPPANNGGNNIASYKVTSTPGSIFQTGLSSPITLSGLTNGTPYTFTVSALNNAGYGGESAPSNSVIPADTPNPPTNIVAVARNTGAVVSFTPPINTGGGPILDYTVFTSNGGPTVVGTTSPISISGLINGIVYSFTVKARNQAYYSAFSSTSNSVTPGVSSPDPPTNVVASLPYPGSQIKITPTAPLNNGGTPLIDYNIFSSEPPGVTGSGYPYILLFGMTLGTAYRFKITARNAAGYSDPSEFSNYITPANVPDYPSSIVATPLDTGASINFVRPTNTGSVPISSYVVTSTPGGFTRSGTVPPIVFTGLTNGTSYSFSIVSTNSSGFSSIPSFPSNSIIPAKLPNPPTSVTAVAGVGYAVVTFVPPTNNGGSPITGYTATSSPGGFTSTGTSSPLTVSGLSNNIRYTFTVVSTNAIGNSVSSNQSNSVSPAAPPPAPLGPSAVVSGSNVIVSFSYPVNTSGANIIDYTATSFSNIPEAAGLTFVSATTPIICTNIPKGIQVWFKIKARSLVGYGSNSIQSNTVTVLTPPAAPTNIVATPGNGQSSVSFTAPTDTGGSAIISYTATSSPGGITGTSPDSPIQVNGLLNDGTAYTFTVTATNAQGTSASSIVSNSVVNGTDPTPPSNIQAIALNASASVSFTPPVYPAFTGGTPIISYSVKSSPGNITATGQSSPILITGLTNNTAYTFTMRSTNASGFTTTYDSPPTTSVTPKSTKWGAILGNSLSWSCASVSGQYVLLGTNDPTNNMYFGVLQLDNSWAITNISFTTPATGQLPRAPWSVVSLYTVSNTEAYALVGSTDVTKAIYGGFYNGVFWKWNQISMPYVAYTSAAAVQAGFGVFYLSEARLFQAFYSNDTWTGELINDPVFYDLTVPSISMSGNAALGATNTYPYFIQYNV